MSERPREPGTATAKGTVGVEELSRGGRTLARRVAEAKATVPEHTLSEEVDMEACVALGGEYGIGFEPMVVRACAIALREHPRANGAHRDGRLETYGRVNVGLAVHGPQALTVPTIFDADRRSLREVAEAARTLAGRVEEGAITSPELSGATFTVSCLDLRAFTAILTPPQAGILAAGAVEQRAAVHEGRLVVRHRMHVTLTCDHRVLFGAGAVAFLRRVRALLEGAEL